MTVLEMARVGEEVDQASETIAEELLLAYGIPSTPNESRNAAEDIYPLIERHRTELYQLTAAEMGVQAAALGYEVRPAYQQKYEPHMTNKMLNRLLGFGDEPMTISVDFLDSVTKETVTHRVVPHALDDLTDEAQSILAARISANVSRHIRQAGRSLIADTASHGTGRNIRTKKKVRLGYARVLTGAENCAFCAMLASRGAVYSEESATKTAAGRLYHANCDCVPRLVFKGEPWEGEKEHKALEELWVKAPRKHDLGEKDYLLKDFAFEWSKANKRKFSPLTS